MSRLARALAIVIVLFAAHGIAPAESAPVGKASRASQTVRLSGSSGTKVATMNTEVHYLDRITTDGSGIGEFVFNDNSKLAVGPSASIVVDQFVLKNDKSFAKLSISAAKGSFRWISGNSAASAYRIKTPRGTMGIRGTAFDVTARGGRVHIVLLSGSARFCNGSTCRTINRTCDYIVADGKGISNAKPAGSAFPSVQAAAKVFPFLANPRLLSSRFAAGGSRCLARVVLNREQQRTNTATATRASTNATGGENVPPPPPGGNVSQAQTCGGNCGVGLGNGGNNGTPNEGRNNRP